MPSARQLAYQFYLESDHWKSLRASVLARDGHKCTRCPAITQLQAHHTLYRARFEDSITADLVTLCRDCHEKEHGIRKQPVIRKARAKPHEYTPDTDVFHLNWKELNMARCNKQISRQQYLDAKARMMESMPVKKVRLRKVPWKKKKKRIKALSAKEWKIRNKYAGWAETAFRVR